MEIIDRGIQVFARAWDANGQIGFGTDGSVDIERFIIINPPVLVADENGKIERTATDSLTGQTWTFTYREDPQEALLQSLEHIIEVKQQKFGDEQIVADSVGNTTTTIYPDAHPESTSVDGYAAFDASTSGWSTIHGATASASASDTPTISNGAYTGKGAGQLWLYRAFFLFDTSSIGSDTINSATFSLYPTAKVTTSLGNEYISLASSSPASNTAITTADYDQVGTTKLAPDLNTSSVTLNAYNNWVLNATGTSTINGAGISKFVLRHGNDIVNSEPSATGYNGINGITWADYTGTTQDPKLVVEHTHINFAPIAPISLQTEGQTNPAAVTDATPEFSAIYKDPDAGDQATWYRLQVSTNPSFTTTHWDSGTTTMATTTVGNRSPDISYAGSALASSTAYYWRIAFSDDDGATGIFSTSTATFSLSPEVTEGAIQNITFSYDANGNITQITDSADTDAWRSRRLHLR